MGAPSSAPRPKLKAFSTSGGGQRPRVPSRDSAKARRAEPAADKIASPPFARITNPLHETVEERDEGCSIRAPSCAHARSAGEGAKESSRFRKLAARWRRLLEEEASGRRARPLRGPRANRPIGDAASLAVSAIRRVSTAIFARPSRFQRR